MFPVVLRVRLAARNHDLPRSGKIAFAAFGISVGALNLYVYRDTATRLLNTAASNSVSSGQQYQGDMTVAINQQAGEQMRALTRRLAKPLAATSAERLRRAAGLRLTIVRSLMQTRQYT